MVRTCLRAHWREHGPYAPHVQKKPVSGPGDKSWPMWHVLAQDAHTASLQLHVEGPGPGASGQQWQWPSIHAGNDAGNNAQEHRTCRQASLHASIRCIKSYNIGMGGGNNGCHLKIPHSNLKCAASWGSHSSQATQMGPMPHWTWQTLAKTTKDDGRLPRNMTTAQYHSRNARFANGARLLHRLPGVGVETALAVLVGPSPIPKPVRRGEVDHGAGDSDQAAGCNNRGYR